MSADYVLAQLHKPRATGPRRWRARCPAHKGRSLTLSVREFDTGVVGLKCFAGCEVEAIVAALGLTLEDLFPPRQSPGHGRPAERRPYSVRQLIDALATELQVAWVVLSDVASDRPVSTADRRRAGVARDRCVMLLQELQHVR